MFHPILASALAAALLYAAPSLAQVYKWVDDKGVVNYSNEAPANRGATQLDPKSVRVSTYSTDDAPRGTAMPSSNDRALSEKIDRLERKLDEERYARQSMMEAQTQGFADARYEQCLRDRRVDCDDAGYDPYYWPYYGPAVVAARPLRSKPFVRHHGAPPKPANRPAFSTVRSTAARQM